MSCTRCDLQVNAIAPGYLRDGHQPRWPGRSWRPTSGYWTRPARPVGVMGPIDGVFLASRASDYVNGHVLVVDGGYLVR